MDKNIDMDKNTITHKDSDGGTVTCSYTGKPFTMRIAYVKGLKSRYQTWEDENTLVCYDPEPDIICISTPFLIN